MNTIGKPERATQDRIIALFSEELGYRYLAGVHVVRLLGFSNNHVDSYLFVHRCHLVLRGNSI